MATLDFIVIGLFALALIGIIIWVLNKTNNSADYFLGGRDATWLAIGASIFRVQYRLRNILSDWQEQGLPAVWRWPIGKSRDG